MTAFVLQRHEDGYFVAERGSSKSYTRDLTRARRFDTRDEAERDRCGNESIVPYEEARTRR